jgi:hypothetical protein
MEGHQLSLRAPIRAGNLGDEGKVLPDCAFGERRRYEPRSSPEIKINVETLAVNDFW